MSDFDLRTHIRDPQTKRVVRTNHYRRHMVPEGDFFERPVDSGNLWYGNNEPAGQLVIDEKGKRHFNRGAEHIPWTAPLSKDAKVLKVLSDQDQKIQDLESKIQSLELASIKEEQKADVAQASVAQKAPEPTQVVEPAPAPQPNLKPWEAGQ